MPKFLMKIMMCFFSHKHAGLGRNLPNARNNESFLICCQSGNVLPSILISLTYSDDLSPYL